MTLSYQQHRRGPQVIDSDLLSVQWRREEEEEAQRQHTVPGEGDEVVSTGTARTHNDLDEKPGLAGKSSNRKINKQVPLELA